MRRLACCLAAAVVMLAAAPAFAHPGHEKGASADKMAKCSYDAQTCLNHWAEKKGSGWMGCELEHLQAAEGAAPRIAVKKVVDGSPAAAAGFQPGDVLIARNGIAMADMEAQKKDKDSFKPGAHVTYTIERGGAKQDVEVTLAALPEEVYARLVGEHMIMNHMTTPTAAAAATEKAK